jgi:hypothetical protein
MKTLSQITLFLGSILILSSSCSKDKSIERSIQKNDGVWNIDNVDWQVVQQSTSGQNITTGSTANAGTFTFENDGTGKYSYTVGDTITRSGSFKWSVDNEKANITYVSQSFSWSGSITQKTVAYTGSTSSKTKLTLEGSETDQYTGGSSYITQFVLTGTFTMTKK